MQCSPNISFFDSLLSIFFNPTITFIYIFGEPIIKINPSNVLQIYHFLIVYNPCFIIL